MAYVELRIQSAFSFLQAASQPEEIVAEAARLGYEALALADLGGVYGVPRFCKAAREAGIRPIVGAIVPLEIALEPGHPSVRSKVLLLCEDKRGWQNLCELLTRAYEGRKKGDPLATLEMLEDLKDGLVALCGGPDGPILTMAQLDKGAAGAVARRLAGIFGKGRLYFDLERHGDPLEEHQNRFLLDLGRYVGIPCIPTNGVRYHNKARGRVLDCMIAIRHHVTLDEAGRLLPPHHRFHLEPPQVMEARFSDLPETLLALSDLKERLRFDLTETGYTFPKFEVPQGETEFSLLYDLVQRGAKERYRPITPRVMQQIAHELDVIARLNLAGYFLLVWDIARFCRENGILAQGRGSAANSCVCYCLGITAVDPIAYDLLFERFLSEERGEWPDIDLDLPSGEDRERVIQYVYQRYGQRSVGMTASVITYRGRYAVRELGKVFGLEEDRIARLSRLIGHYEYPDEEDLCARLGDVGLSPKDPRVARFLEIFSEIQDLPRHLSQHNGGLVIAGGRLDRVVPLEPARMPNRTVIQWDKDDLADLRIIKVDLLGLGMLAAIKECISLVRRHEGVEVDLAHLPKEDPLVFEMLQKADTVGVFQVESRAQMATLPRMKPQRFYDLVIEVAIIRPGPIVGQMVSPYLQRRQGRAPVRYAHPSLKPILERTLGVPLFQEQVMRMAMAVGGFTGGQAEELRRAMGSRRSKEKMERLMGLLREGMARNGLSREAQDEIVQSIVSFSQYGFPESHAASFALIAYASAYLKVHHKAAFYAALLNQWPMGFYHPATLVRDAQRHGVEVRPIDVLYSEWECSLEGSGDGLAVRLGLKYVKGLSRRTGERIVEERRRAPFEGISDLAERTGASRDELMALAKAGAIGRARREAMWQVLAACSSKGLLARAYEEGPEPGLPPQSLEEEVASDFEATGLSVGPHPMALYREELKRMGVRQAASLAALPDGIWVKVAGMVIVRQRPGTAKGMFFATLEDETGFANLVVTPQTFRANRALLSAEPFLLAEGPLQNRDGVISVLGKRFEALRVLVRHGSHDFR